MNPDSFRPYFSDEDYYHYNAPRKLSRWQKFTSYVLPFIVLAGICFGIYLSMSWLLQGMIELSGPLCDKLICNL